MNRANAKKCVTLVLISTLLVVVSSCGPDEADLTGSIDCPAQAFPGEELGDSIEVTVTNAGVAEADDFSVELVLSSDTTLLVEPHVYSSNFGEDVLLQGGRENVESLEPGESLDLPLYGSNKIPDDTPPGDYQLGFVLDPLKTVEEFDEENNTGLCPIHISECSPVADIIGGQIVEASGGTTGYARLRLAWMYGTGEKPERLLITVYRRFGDSEWDNIMPGDEPFEVSSPSTTTETDVTIYRLVSADYRLVFTAYYSCDREQEFSFDREI